jgi:hypothetical protein
MHVIVLTVAFDELRAEVLADRSEDCGQVPDCKLGENSRRYFVTKTKMNMQCKNAVSSAPIVLHRAHRPSKG